jgi:hypothetical protein
MPGNESLRRELDAASKIRVKSEYQRRLGLLKDRFQHSIRVLPDGKERMERFNCFAYALGAWNNPRYERLVDQSNTSAVTNSVFIMDVLNRGELVEVIPEAVQPNDIVLYFANDQLKHAGRVNVVAAELVIHSKWGGNEVHEHKLWELPFEHGDRVRFFRPTDADELLDRLEAAHLSARPKTTDGL